MPPDPILALLCLAGLVAYIALGGVVGAWASRMFLMPDHIKALQTRQYTGKIEHVRRGDYTIHYAGNAWLGFGIFALLWPLVLVSMALFAVGRIVAVGPIWLVTRTGLYVLNSGTGDQT